MVEEVKCLKILKEGLSLKDIFKEEFLNKLDENFEGLDIFPIGIALAIQKEDITEDFIQLSYKNDDDIENNVLLIDIQNNPEYMSKIINTLTFCGDFDDDL